MGRVGKIVIAVLLILLLIRVAAPPIILSKLNRKLEEISSTYRLHVQDLDLSLLRMAYRFEGATARVKASNHLLFKADAVDVSVSWSELFRGRILTDISLKNVFVNLTKEVIERTKTMAPADKQVATQSVHRLFPLRISRIKLENGTVQFGDFVDGSQDPRWRISAIQGAIANLTNLTNRAKAPLTYVTLQGRLLASSVFKSAGRVNRNVQPIAWELDAEVRDFDLKQTNELARRYVPLTFTAGHLDLFTEVKSTGGKIRGYIKPFFKNVHVLGNSRDFKNLKHFAVEIVTAIGNALLRRSDTQTVATEIAFFEDHGQLKIDKGKAVAKAVQHGFREPIPKGIEEKINID
jgi:hypothetical protein